ncbi:glycosyltransferase [Listeria weihenstephanensis FSL R9-0317]|uniref:Glycosyltransferase n=1 Tax=Listeria weihenstephanensis TaxID=1006155 RepID=A0A1S7FTC6_9LIST|nr:glycosyltransferase family 2 protein [Listeria weihenstephanensis]AQY50650.1 glycosyltransferase [Listeria weihenstephanensis]EUJ35608.1 glycosyltransferase [Listeria weihenstephanensis FSL R9-0317]
MAKKISVVIPLYNEEAVIEQTYERMTHVMEQLAMDYELLFVNDGSKDKTLSLVQAFSFADPHVKCLHFSRNFGHQIAITAGTDYASGDAVIIIDADLQDPPELIPEMIQKWQEGYDVVYAQRMKRNGETFFKKWSAKIFYRTLHKLTDVEIPVDTGDFRLMDKKVYTELKKLNEKNPFVRGLVSWLGFKQTALLYEREERAAGETKYPLKKMLKLSIDGITSFSYQPLKLASYAGAALSGAGFVYMLIVLFQTLFTDTTVNGWSSMIIIQLLFSGFVLVILGMIGEYIGRIYDEVKDRPLYIVAESYGFDPKRANSETLHYPTFMEQKAN